jgi:predicted O-methyltransferase YrrM
MIILVLNRVKAAILRRFGYNLDRGHTWEKLSAQYSDIETQTNLYRFIVELFPIWSKTENTLLIERAKNIAQIRDAKSLLGDHYRLLKAIAVMVQAKKVVDIGTYTGMSAITFMDANCEVISFDITSPFGFDDCLVAQSDIESGKLQLVNEDIKNEKVFDKYVQSFIDADIIFLDGPKYGGFEQLVLPKILNLDYYKNTLVIMDDIQMKKMKILWYELNSPRLDMSLLGHISGTGVIFPFMKK